jgi:hypothetical protein
MIFAILQNQCSSEEEFACRQLELGLDPFLHLGPLPMSFDPSVSTSLDKQQDPEGEGYLLEKTYRTPAGDLQAVVHQTEDWPHGDSAPLFDDYLIPRSKKFLVTGRKDLPALRYLFADFRHEDVGRYRERAKELLKFASKHDLPTAAGWGRGGEPGVMAMEAATWLVGMQNLMLLVIDEPETVTELAGIIADWNRKQVEIILDPCPDLVVRRGWYESCDFWTPKQFQEYIQPSLQAEAKLTHQAGAKYGYIITSSMMPILPHILAAGVDVIIGVDPVQGKGTDLRGLKEAVSNHAALWGGVNGFLTVELGSTDEVRRAVREAIDILAPGSGFILSPVDNVREDSPRAWENVRTLIQTCHAYGKYS